MMARFFLVLAAILSLAVAVPGVQAQQGPLQIEIEDGVIEPLPFAVPDFVPGNAEAQQLSAQISRVVAANLTGTGLFREVPSSSFISTLTDFSGPIEFPDWRAIGVRALISGAVVFATCCSPTNP